MSAGKGRAAVLSLAGAVLLDLRELDTLAMRRRMGALATIPTGCRLVLIVGPLAPDSAVCWLLHEHAHRLAVDVWGEPHSVPRWLAAIRSDALAAEEAGLS